MHVLGEIPDGLPKQTTDVGKRVQNNAVIFMLNVLTIPSIPRNYTRTADATAVAIRHTAREEEDSREKAPEVVGGGT